MQSLPWVRVALLPLPWERVGVRASNRTISITYLLAHRYPTYKNEELSRRFPSPYPSPKGRGNYLVQSLAWVRVVLLPLPWERELFRAILAMGAGCPSPSPKGRGNCSVQSLPWVRAALLPLPVGEGRGEGIRPQRSPRSLRVARRPEQGLQRIHCRNDHLVLNLCRTIQLTLYRRDLCIIQRALPCDQIR